MTKEEAKRTSRQVQKNEYMRSTYRTYSIRFNRVMDADIIDMLDNCDNIKVLVTKSLHRTMMDRRRKDAKKKKSSDQ